MGFSDSVLAAAGQYRAGRINTLSRGIEAPNGVGQFNSVKQFQQQLKQADLAAIRQKAAFNAQKFAQAEQQANIGKAVTWGAANPDTSLDLMPADIAPYADHALAAQHTVKGEKEKAAAAIAKVQEDAAAEKWYGQYGPVLATDPSKLPPEAYATAPKGLRDDILSRTAAYNMAKNREDATNEEAKAYAALDAAPQTEQGLMGVGPLPPKASESRQRRINALRAAANTAADNARADAAAKALAQTKDASEKARGYDDAMKMLYTSFSEYRRQFGGGVDMAKWIVNAPPAMKALYDNAKKYAVSVGRDLNLDMDQAGKQAERVSQIGTLPYGLTDPTDIEAVNKALDAAQAAGDETGFKAIQDAHAKAVKR